MRSTRFVWFAAVLLVLHGLAASFGQRGGGGRAMAALPGGVHDAPAGSENDLHVQELARFAVQEHNKNANALLEFEKVVKVRQQVVAGLMYYLTVEAKEGGVKKLYEAKVWEKTWENFKKLEDFKPMEDSTNA